MARKVTPCTVKSGPNTGASYYVYMKRDWGKPSYSVDPERTGWHPSPSMARAAAEKGGYVYIVNPQGGFMMVHESAAKYYTTKAA